MAEEVCWWETHHKSFITPVLEDAVPVFPLINTRQLCISAIAFKIKLKIKSQSSANLQQEDSINQ